MEILYDNAETILETIFDTIYTFLWIWYVNVCFFKYNRRMQELEIEIVGLRRIVYAFINDNITKTNIQEKKQLVSKNNRNIKHKNKNNEIEEKLLKLKKGVFFLKKHMDELTERVEVLEEDNEDYVGDDCSSATCTDDDASGSDTDLE